MAHPPGRGPDRARNAGHREDNRLGDLIKDHPPAPDIAQTPQPEHAELRLQQIANLVEPVLALVDPGARVRAGIRQEPSDALRCGRRRMHLDRQEQAVRVQQAAEQARAIGRVELARERHPVPPSLVARRFGLATALIDRQLDILGRDVFERVVQPVEPRGDIGVVGSIGGYPVGREHRQDAIAPGQHDIVGDVVFERNFVAQQGLGALSHLTPPRGPTAPAGSASFPACRTR